MLKASILQKDSITKSHPIAELWYEKMYNLLSDSSWKLETRWAAFKLPSRHPKILVEKLKRCVETINNSDWFDYHIIESDRITEDYPMEVHNIIHHHFELLGWPETKVTLRFWIFGIICALLGILVAIL